jgi:hypothetical protein
MTKIPSKSALLFLLLCAFAPKTARAHGLHGHIHVTGWAIENLPEGELRDFFDDPEVFEAALSGARFPDTGYARNNVHTRTYAETAHWEPFIEAFIQHARTTYGPTYTKEEKLVIAFLLGCASHGLQDELFDSTFMYEAEQRDGHGQEALDPGTDGFLVEDGYFRHLPNDFMPYPDLLALYADVDPEITQPLIELQVLIVNVYVNAGPGLDFARDNAERYRPELPWSASHYLDASVPGSLRAEVFATGRHIEALWERLHDRYDDQDLLVHTWPEETRRLREADHTSVASWVTFVLGKGIEPDTTTGTIVDENGASHPVEVTYTRWGGTSRIVRFKPTADFVPGGRYTATLHAGATLVDGSVTTTDQSLTFQVACTAADDPSCPALPEAPEPSLDTPLAYHQGGGCAAAPADGSIPSLTAVLAALSALCLLRKRTRRP